VRLREVLACNSTPVARLTRAEQAASDAASNCLTFPVGIVTHVERLKFHSSPNLESGITNFPW